MDKNKTAKMIKSAFRIPVIFAVVGAYLNSAELLAEFQPDGRAWVAYVAAASVGLGLFLSVEALLHRSSPVLIVAVVGYGLAEISGQVLHAALVRGDVVVMTDTMRWVMGYLSPSLVVVAGVGAAFVAHYGLSDTDSQLDPLGPVIARLDALQQAQQGAQQAQGEEQGIVPLADLLKAAESVEDPEHYVIDPQKRVITKSKVRIGLNGKE